MKLRPYQDEAVNQVIGDIELFGSDNVILEAPTGSGKSVIISELCKQLNGNIVIMVNISPLIDQIANHLTEMKIDYSILKAGMEEHYNESHKVQLVMSQTFYARHESLNIDCDYLIIDERHREYDTDRTRKLVRELKPKAIIGLTATPYDQSGMALKNGSNINTVTVKQLTDDGYLSPIKYFIPKWSTDLGLEDLRTSGNDYSGSAIDEKFNNQDYIEAVIESMNQVNAKEKKTLVFCNSIEQSELVTEALQGGGYQAEAIHSKKADKENKRILDEYKDNGSVKCLVSVSKLNIGFDVKDVELGVMLRPTKVRSLYIQTVGRLTRIAEGKTHGEFLDLAGTVMEHGFHDEVYHPPENKKELLEAKTSHEAQQVKYIVNEEPTEINRKKINVYVKELEERKKHMEELKIAELSSIFEEATDVYTIVKCAFLINQAKTGVKFKANTVSWISDHWEYYMANNPEFSMKWTKALKTRAKNIVRDNKKLASLYYFIEFLDENKYNF